MFYGMRVGYGVTAVGDCQVMTLSADVIDDSYALNAEPLLKEASRILAEVVLEPVMEEGAFRETDIELEKQSLIDLIESEINEKRYYALNRAMSVLCAGEPAGVNKYGYIEDVKKISPRSAAEAYAGLLETARIEVMFVGCGDPNQAKQILEQAFSGIKRNPRQFDVFTVKKEAVLKEETDRMNVAQSKLVLGFRTAGSPG